MNRHAQRNGWKRAAFGTVALCAILLFGFPPDRAAAFFSGEAGAGGGMFSAGTFAIASNESLLAGAIGASGTSTVTFDIDGDGGSIPGGRYMLAAEKVAGACEDDFYNGVVAGASFESMPRHNGSLSALAATATGEGEWSLDLAAGAALSAASGETCEITLTVTAWQGEFPNATTGGFTDVAEITLTLTASEPIGAQKTTAVVLNEIYPNENDTESPPLEREWVELYNGTGAAVSVEGWRISEIYGGTEMKHVISASHTCAAGAKVGNARPYNGAPAVVPAGGRLVIELCAANRLKNSDDTVSLYDAGDTLIDTHTYPDTAKGKSHQRIPDGGPWYDPIPTPGEPNYITEGELRELGFDEKEIALVMARQKEAARARREAEEHTRAVGGTEPRKMQTEPADAALVPTDKHGSEQKDEDENDDTDDADAGGGITGSAGDPDQLPTDEQTEGKSEEDRGGAEDERKADEAASETKDKEENPAEEGEEKEKKKTEIEEEAGGEPESELEPEDEDTEPEAEPADPEPEIEQTV